MDNQLKAIYKTKEVKDSACQAAARDWYRQWLLRRYTHLQDVLGSPHPWAALAPARHYILSIIAYQIERNTIKHLYYSTQLYLKRLTHRNTLSWAYKHLTKS